MCDYQIVRFCDGDVGVYVESDWAAIRGGETSLKGLVTVFKSRRAALQFVREGEAEGYTFDGKNRLERCRYGNSTSEKAICSDGVRSRLTSYESYF
jgi:hypothetical protein